jgi:hypothetical protein
MAMGLLGTTRSPPTAGSTTFLLSGSTYIPTTNVNTATFTGSSLTGGFPTSVDSTWTVVLSSVRLAGPAIAPTPGQLAISIARGPNSGQWVMSTISAIYNQWTEIYFSIAGSTLSVKNTKCGYTTNVADFLSSSDSPSVVAAKIAAAQYVTTNPHSAYVPGTYTFSWG